jgi:uncharacterized protein YcaQ
MRSFPELRHQLERASHGSSRHAGRAQAAHAREMAALLERIRRGARSRPRTSRTRAARESAGFWEWKAEKRWLEAWFGLGELMVARRERFQRAYDVTSHVPPPVSLPRPWHAGVAC